MSEYHFVVKGDTLSKIAEKNGTTVSELIRINNLKSPNKLQIGQQIALHRQTALGIQPLFLDRNRDPISGLEYILEYAGKSIRGKTPSNGLGQKIFTDSIDDEVRILIRRIDGSLKEVTRVISGSGNKLITLISPSLKISTTTEKHPQITPGEYPVAAEKPKPAYDPKQKQPPTNGKKPGLQIKKSATPDGKPVTIVTGDIPDLSFLGEYVGGEITKADIESAAAELKCEAGLIYAIAKQESAHSSFIQVAGRTVPTILYERHWFRKLTRPKKGEPSPYEDKYHDICGPAYHKVKKIIVTIKSGARNNIKKRELVDAITEKSPIADDVYGPTGLSQYKRLSKAYQLDKAAALESTSWGKFQIMGFNYKACNYADVFAFVKAMCSGDPAHIKAFLRFANNNPILLDGLRSKNYEKIAEGHNGSGWKGLNPHYASNLEKYANEYSK
jgi:LysM repeat protein